MRAMIADMMVNAKIDAEAPLNLRAAVSHDLGLHLMRFVMMEHLLPPEEVLTFLQNLADTLAALTSQLRQYAAAADFPGRHPRLALDHGIAIHLASLRWAEQTVAALSADPRCPPAIDVRHSSAR